MKVSYNWLKDYVNIKVSPEELADTLTMAGFETTHIQKIDSDFIFTMEITSNRPDWISLIGVAREVAASTGAALKIPKPKSGLENFTAPKKIVEVKEKGLCPRYSARLITGVKVGPSPEWLKNKIIAAGLRPVNNIVDITNFCMLETGQPMHAFDLNKLVGQKIIVRLANNNEKIMVIDGKTYELSAGMLVVADEAKPVAIAGVMGGANCEVKDSTKDILLEAAYFDPVATRRTSRTLGLATDSSYRFERSVDIHAIAEANLRASSLISEIALAHSVSRIIDIKSAKLPASKEVTLNITRMNKLLGASISKAKTQGILNKLGFKILKSKADEIIALAPSFRQDISLDVDLIEEVARIYGYEKIPSRNKFLCFEQADIHQESVAVKTRARDILLGFGLDEIITYSLIGENTAAIFGAIDRQAKIQNPLSSQFSALRQSLLSGMLEALKYNINHANSDLKLFEISGVYFDGDSPLEKTNICVGLCGRRFLDWQNPKNSVDFFDIKGVAERLFELLGISDYQINYLAHQWLDEGQAAVIKVKDRQVGFLGKVSRQILEKYDIKTDVFACEICLDDIMGHVRLSRKVKHIVNLPAARRDISMLVKADINCERIANLIKSAGGHIVADVRLFDQYIGKQVPSGFKSLAYSIKYQNPSKTLTDQEVNEAHSNICGQLTEKFQVQIR